MKIRFLGVFLVVLLISLTGVLAATTTEFNYTKSYDWLDKNLDKNINTLDVESLSWGILALLNKDYDVSDYVTKLESKEIGTVKNNWNGNVRNTALATLALSKVGKNIDDEVKWLKEQEKSAYTGTGTWYVTIDSDKTGSCTSQCGSTKSPVTFEYTSEGKIKTGSRSEYMLELSYLNCATSDGVIEIKCESLTDAIVTIFYQSPDRAYHIVDSQSNRATFYLTDRCYTSGSECDYTTTVYTAWALSEVGESVSDLDTYLLEKKDENIANRALLYLVKGESEDGSFLKSEESTAVSSWGNLVFETSLANLALRTSGYTDYTGEKEGLWIQSKAGLSGDWGSVINTAAALISLEGSLSSGGTVVTAECETDSDCVDDETCEDGECVEIVENCTNDIDDDNDDLIDCLDLDDCCEDIHCENETACQDYEPGKETDCTDGFDNDFDLDTDCADDDCVGSKECEGVIIPPEDQSGGLEVCDNGIDDDGDFDIDCADSDCTFDSACESGDSGIDNVPSTPEGGSKAWIWILVILLILILAGVGLFLYMKKSGKSFSDIINSFKFKKGKKKPSFDDFLKEETTKEKEEPLLKPSAPVRSQRPQKRDELEDELEKSIREAEKLLTE